MSIILKGLRANTAVASEHGYLVKLDQGTYSTDGGTTSFVVDSQFMECSVGDVDELIVKVPPYERGFTLYSPNQRYNERR